MMPKIRLFRVNRDKRYEGRFVEEHSHNYYEFVYYINAEGGFILNGEQRRIKRGRFTLITPGTVHSEQHTKDGIVFFCVFECDILLENGIYDDDPDGTILRLCESVASEFFSPREYSTELLELEMRELILRTLRWGASAPEKHRDISYAAEYIERGFRENISLSALARDIGYGYDYFHHIFKKKYGRSPKQYILDCRIKCAKQLLRAGRYSCTEVAYLSGFSDSAQFSKLFRRECGIPPSEFV